MAAMGKVKALQIWCKNRVLGYREVEITNMTSSWRDGLAFCALIHKFRPDLIDYDSLSKENVFENNDLAFEVAEDLGIPALLDAEDMVRLETPDKLSIITYVAQLHNYFRDKEPAGGPGIKTAASKRHSTPVQRSVTMRSPESKRKPIQSSIKRSESETTSPVADICIECDGKVYLIEKHIVDGKLYHRSCYKRNSRPERPASALISTPKSTETTSSPLRPVSLVSNGFKTPSTSLPTTPSTPTDTRPEWQRRIQDKSVGRRSPTSTVNRMSSQPVLTSLKEDPGSKTKSNTTNLPKTESERVQMRNRPIDTVLRKSPLPRAVSVGVDLDERISKLRQLRASAKTSSSAPNAAVRARLEKLRELTAAGGLRTDSKSTNKDPSEQTLAVKDGHSELRLKGANSSEESQSIKSSAESVSSLNKDETDQHLADGDAEREAEREQESSGKEDVISSMETSDCSEYGGKAETPPTDTTIMHSNDDSVMADNKGEQISDNVVETTEVVVDDTPCAIIENGATTTPASSVGASKTKSAMMSTNPFEDDAEEEITISTASTTPTQPIEKRVETVGRDMSGTVNPQTSSAPLAPTRSRRSAAGKTTSSANSPSVSTSSPNVSTSGPSVRTSSPSVRTFSPSVRTSSPSVSPNVSTSGPSVSTSSPSISTSGPSGEAVDKRTAVEDAQSIVTARSPGSSLNISVSSHPVSDSVSCQSDNVTPNKFVEAVNKDISMKIPESADEDMNSDIRRGCQVIELEIKQEINGVSTNGCDVLLEKFDAIAESNKESFTEKIKVAKDSSEGVKGADPEAPWNEEVAREVVAREEVAGEVVDAEKQEGNEFLCSEVMQDVGGYKHLQEETVGAAEENSIEDVTQVSVAESKAVEEESKVVEELSGHDDMCISQVEVCEEEADKINDGQTNVVIEPARVATEPARVVEVVEEEVKDEITVMNESNKGNMIHVNNGVEVIEEVSNAAISSSSSNADSANGEVETVPASLTPEAPDDTCQFLPGHEVDSKTPKPERPPVSPAVVKRLTSNTSQSHSDSESHSHGDITSLLESADTGSKHGGDNSKKAPPRPASTAKGPVSKSQFYMDENHTNVKEPPPKPARQSALTEAVAKAKDSWEDTLDNWSTKRKDQQGSTWYTTETYPTEHNPFGDDEEEITTKPNVNHNNAIPPSATTTNYDDALNPFADDEEDNTLTYAPSQSEESPRKKVIPANPFEVSDEEEEEIVERKKIIPQQGLTTEKSKTTKSRHVIVLPDTRKQTTPKKKVAPPPPPSSLQTPPPTQSPPTSLEAPPSILKSVTKSEDVNSPEIFITNNEPREPRVDDMDSEESKGADVLRKKHRPAPPRPLPPKRRVQSEFGLDPDEIAKELASLETKQRQLEEKGRLLEQAIRTTEQATMDSQESVGDDDELLSSWLETINEKNQLVRRESELVFIAKHHELEIRQADIEYELRQIMHRAENLKSDVDKKEEEELLNTLVSVVHERSKLVDTMDNERIRQQEEDREVHTVLGAQLRVDKASSSTNSGDTKKTNKTDKKKKKKGK